MTLKELNYRIDELSNVIIPLGTQGENNARVIKIDMSEWVAWGLVGYPMIHVLSPDGTLYPAITGYDPDTHVLQWYITNIITAEYGNGSIEISMYDSDGTIGKSVITRTLTLPSYHKCDVDTPDAYEDWLDALSQLAAETGSHAIIVQKALAEIADLYQSAINLENAAKAYAETLQAFTGGYSVLDTFLDLSLAQDDWNKIADDIYTMSKENLLFKEHSFLDIYMDDISDGRLKACLEWQTSDGSVLFKTAVKPSGDLTIKVKLQGSYLLANDKTLTLADRAADSKTVGDRFNEIVNAMTSGAAATNSSLQNIYEQIQQLSEELDRSGIDSQLLAFQDILDSATGNYSNIEDKVNALEQAITAITSRIATIRSCTCGGTETTINDDAWVKNISIADDYLEISTGSGDWYQWFGIDEDGYVYQLSDPIGTSEWGTYFMVADEYVIQTDIPIPFETTSESTETNTSGGNGFTVDVEVLDAIVALSVSRMSEILKFIPDSNTQALIDKVSNSSEGGGIANLYGLKIDNYGFYYQD